MVESPANNLIAIASVVQRENPLYLLPRHHKRTRLYNPLLLSIVHCNNCHDFIYHRYTTTSLTCPNTQRTYMHIHELLHLIINYHPAVGHTFHTIIIHCLQCFTLRCCCSRSTREIFYSCSRWLANAILMFVTVAAEKLGV